MRLNAKQLRVTRPSEDELAIIKRKPIWIVLDNVMDTYNIGSIFRLADAVAAKEVILCAGAETPPSSRIHKAAVGTEEWVPWRYFKTCTEAMRKIREEVEGIKVIAVEQDPRAIGLFELAGVDIEGSPVAIVVGHETQGVAPEALDMADTIVEIPMWGVNKSLNVVVSSGIVVYNLLK